MDKGQLKRAVSQINNLYILNRSTYLKQTNSGYLTIKAKTDTVGKRIIPYLNDYYIERHLQRKETYGILLGNSGLTKFITFDIDIPDDDGEAVYVTKELHDLLVGYYGLSEDEVHISFSGSKGYHIELFFDKAVPYYNFLPFYKEILMRLNESEERIEFRPSKQGVKLPLSLNRKTNTYCYFTDSVTFKPKEDSIEYLLSIQPTNYAEFKELILDEIIPEETVETKVSDLTMNHEQADQFDRVISDLNLEGKSVQEIEKEIIEVLVAGHLLTPGTRNRMTLLIPMFYYSQGEEESKVLQITEKVLLTTYQHFRGLIDPSTTEEKVISEVKRITKLVYEKGYTLTGKRKAVVITKEDILEVLTIKEWNLKRMYLAMILQARRYSRGNSDFYMSYSTMAQYGITKERTRALKQVLELEALGKIKVVSRGVIDLEASQARGQAHHKANRYKVHQKFDEGSTETLIVEDDIEIEKAIATLLSKEEAMDFLSRSQYYNKMKEYYA